MLVLCCVVLWWVVGVLVLCFWGWGVFGGVFLCFLGVVGSGGVLFLGWGCFGGWWNDPTVVLAQGADYQLSFLSLITVF